MKKLMKKVALVLVAVMALSLLGGCGQKFDASAYLKAILDNSYKNDSTAFVELKIGTAEEAAALYEEGIETELQGLVASAEISEEQGAQFREVLADMLGGVKYTVGEAEKQDDDSYIVTITYEQMNVFGPTVETYMADIEAMATAWAESGEYPSDEEMNEAILESLKNCLAETLANVTYDEAATTTVKIELVDNVYTPVEADLYNLEYVLFDLEELMNMGF